MPDRYELRNFTPERLAAVAAEWEGLAGADEFQVELAAIFEWCGGHLLHREGDGHALEVFNVDRGTTDAILEIVNARRGALTKLLKIWVSPEFWAISSSDKELQSRAVTLYAATHVQVIAHGVQSGAEEVRIYGRTNPMLEILILIQDKWDSFGTDWKASMQGRWLSISKEKVA